MTFKRINPKETIFHHVEVTSTIHTLFDSELDIPIIHGSKARVDAVVRNLSKSVRINYYKLNDDTIKLKQVYDGRKGRS